MSWTDRLQIIAVMAGWFAIALAITRDNPYALVQFSEWASRLSRSVTVGLHPLPDVKAKYPTPRPAARPGLLTDFTTAAVNQLEEPMETGQDDATGFLDAVDADQLDSHTTEVVVDETGARAVVYDQAQEHEHEVGDVTGEHPRPVLETAVEVKPVDVIINVRVARDPRGAQAIHINYPTEALTAAQAHRLAIDLTEASEIVADIRQKAGYES